jgi:hypothetical protein
MEHPVLQAPTHFNLEAVLRRGQVRGLGGAEHLAKAVVQTPLGTSYTHEDFCEKVVIVLVEQQILGFDAGAVDCRLYTLAEIRRARSGAAW